MKNIKIVMYGKETSKETTLVDVELTYDKAVFLIQICKLLQSEIYNQCNINAYEEIIDKRLLEIGIPVKLSGFRYIKTAVVMAINDETMLDGITKNLYFEVAKAHSSTASRVEKGIRHAIELAWERGGNVDFKNEIHFGGLKRPSNLEFLRLMCRDIKKRI